MMDFLKAYPNVTKEQYMWEWTVPQIKLAVYDNTHIDYSYKKNNRKVDKASKEKVMNLNSIEDIKKMFGDNKPLKQL